MQFFSHNQQKIINKDLLRIYKNSRKNLESDIEIISTVCDYLFKAQGKRIRPMLMLIVSKCFALNRKKLTDNLATIIELIHTATLLHDDVVDESKMRRSMQSINSKFGNSIAVLVGDFIYSKSFQIMATLNSNNIVSILSDCTNKIAEGEVLQSFFANNINITIDDYLVLIESKTAQLFETSCHLALIDSKYENKIINSVKRFGKHLGMAFQITDDILDYEGVTKKTGKKNGIDFLKGYYTLPLIYALSNSSRSEKKQIIKFLVDDNLKKDFKIIQNFVISNGGLHTAKDTATSYIHLAKKELAKFPNNHWKNSLISICDSMLDRKS